MKKNLIIIGTGATGRRVYRFVKMYNLYNVIGFAVDKEYIKENTFMELPIFPLEDIKQVAEKENAEIFVAILWNNLNSDRKKLYLRLKKNGLSFANIISPTAVIRGEIRGDNCWINDYVIVQSDAVIESNVYVMDAVVIGNESLVKSHVFIAPSSCVGGGAVIGEQCFVGIKAVVFDDTVIGEKCIIGATTSIKRNVNNNTVCKVSSDNIIQKEYNASEVETKLKTNHNVR